MVPRLSLNRFGRRSVVAWFGIASLALTLLLLRGSLPHWSTPIVAEPAVGSLPTAAPMAPAAAPDATTGISCRPAGSATDQVRVGWLDTNDGGADYQIQRQDIAGGSWGDLATVAGATCNVKGACQYVDENAGSSAVFRYRVRAANNDGSSG